jgi:hypothetical protein
MMSPVETPALEFLGPAPEALTSAMAFAVMSARTLLLAPIMIATSAAFALSSLPLERNIAPVVYSSQVVKNRVHALSAAGRDRAAALERDARDRSTDALERRRSRERVAACLGSGAVRATSRSHDRRPTIAMSNSAAQTPT